MPRKSELLFIVLVLAEILIIPWIYGRVRSGEPLFPTPTPVYDRDYEILRKGSCVAYQQPYPADIAHQTFTQNIDMTAPDGKTRLCLTVIQNSGAEWKFSPDGQYIRLYLQFTHGYRFRLFEISTPRELCWNQFDDGRYVGGSNCPVLQLADGRWWKGDFPDIFLKTGDPSIWNLVGASAKLSPDGEWITGESGEWVLEKSGESVVAKSGGWYLGRTNGNSINRFSIPYPYGSVSANAPPCGYSTSSGTVWRADSKQFAVRPWGDKVIYVWSILENGDVRLDDRVILEKCSYLSQLTPEGKVITKPWY